MAKTNKITAKSLVVYNVANDGIVVPCTGTHKQLAERRVRKLQQKTDDRIYDLIGVRQ